MLPKRQLSGSCAIRVVEDPREEGGLLRSAPCLLLDKAARIEARALAMGSAPVGDSADVVEALED